MLSQVIQKIIKSIAKNRLRILLIICIIGFLDSLYLAYKAIFSEPLPCLIGSSCDTVTTSIYGKFMGIPVSVYGILYYIFGIALFLFLMIKELKIKVLPFIFSITGLSVSIYFTFIQYFVLEAFCTYCLLSAICTIFIFLLIFFSKNITYPQKSDILG